VACWRRRDDREGRRDRLETEDSHLFCVTSLESLSRSGILDYWGTRNRHGTGVHSTVRVFVCGRLSDKYVYVCFRVCPALDTWQCQRLLYGHQEGFDLTVHVLTHQTVMKRSQRHCANSFVGCNCFKPVSSVDTWQNHFKPNQVVLLHPMFTICVLSILQAQKKPSGTKKATWW